MFGHWKLTHSVAGHNTSAEVDRIGHAAAIGLSLPLAFSAVGGLIGGFVFAMIGFGIGLATCVVSIEILTALSSD
jgi:hypothetical protein